MTTLIIRLINEIKIYVLLKIEMLLAIQTNVKCMIIVIHHGIKKFSAQFLSSLPQGNHVKFIQGCLIRYIRIDNSKGSSLNAFNRIRNVLRISERP